MRDGAALKAGDELRQYVTGGPAQRAIVDDVTTNYVKLRWGRGSNGDMLRKDSPLWQLLELIE